MEDKIPKAKVAYCKYGNIYISEQYYASIEDFIEVVGEFDDAIMIADTTKYFDKED